MPAPFVLLFVLLNGQFHCAAQRFSIPSFLDESCEYKESRGRYGTRWVPGLVTTPNRFEPGNDETYEFKRERGGQRVPLCPGFRVVAELLTE